MGPDERWCVGVRSLGIPGHYTSKDNFYVINRKREDGTRSVRIDSYCKDCSKERVKKWRQKNPEKVSEYNRTWWEGNLEENRAKARERGRLERGKFAWTWKRHRIEYEADRLPADPFRDWLQTNIMPMLASKKEVQEASGEGGGVAGDLITYTWIAEQIGVDKKSITNYTSGKTKTVPREIIDRIGLIFGHMNLSDDLYEDQSEEAA
jgi:hypothetical protein